MKRYRFQPSSMAPIQSAVGLAMFGLVTVAARATPLVDPFTDARGAGAGSVRRDGPDAFSLPFKNATREHHRSFVIGNALFKENWVPAPSSVRSRQGLGPLLNAQSCSTCHFKDGRGLPPETADEVPTGILLRLSIDGTAANGGPLPHPVYGDQLQHRGILGVAPKADVKIDYKSQTANYPDGTKYELRTPVVKIINPRLGELGDKTLISPRLAPAVIGLGLLEAIPEKQILALADPDDKDGDGISGRPNWVWDFKTKRAALGRFGWKANQTTLDQQNASAFSGDMGLTSALFPDDNCPKGAADCRKALQTTVPELSEQDLRAMTVYIQLLAVPERRNLNDPETLKGRNLFAQANCQGCHASQFVTGNVAGFPELSHQKIHPYTDLLLHDMGEDLADHRPDFKATGTQWRTPPLWGLGLADQVNGRARFLHDGRARTLEEAILWHGGEAERARETFKNLSAADRAALLKFVGSL